MQPLVSVIVPVYKVEDCLVRCLDSLCRQMLQNIEIILVDDASPDQCGAICEEYVAKDSRFKVIHHLENRGLSAARNTGINEAIADYLMFVDSDDWVNEHFCKVAYECAVSYQADLVIFRYERIGYSFNSYRKNVVIPSGFKTKIEIIDLMVQGIEVPFACNKLYRKELFRNISYPLGYLHEDVGTTHKIVWQSDCIYFLNKVLYYHCYHKGSITTLQTEKSLRDWVEMNLLFYHDLVDWNYSSDKLDDLIINVCFTYCIRKKADYLDDKYVFCANVLRSCKNTPYYFSWKRKVLFALFKCNRSLFELVCVLFSKKLK